METHLRDEIARIHALLCENDADEVLLNGSRGVFLVDRTGARRGPELFSSVDFAADFARELAWHGGRRLDPFHPATGGSIDEWQLRWHAVINPVAQDEIILSIRRHRFAELPLEHFISNGDHLEIIERSIRKRLPILIGGPTGVGKTTFLVSLLRRYFFESRVAIMESLSEIPALSTQWFRMTETPTQISGSGGFSLMEVGRECMRLRPDVLVVGELRGAEAEVFLDMSQTGHGGCLATIHGGTIDEARRRLVRLAGAMSDLISNDFRILVVLLRKTSIGAEVMELAEVYLRDELSKKLKLNQKLADVNSATLSPN